MNPESTKNFIVQGDNRHERTLQLLDSYKKMIFQSLTHLHCFVLFGKKVHGLPEFHLFIL